MGLSMDGKILIKTPMSMMVMIDSGYRGGLSKLRSIVSLPIALSRSAAYVKAIE